MHALYLLDDMLFHVNFYFLLLTCSFFLLVIMDLFLLYLLRFRKPNQSENTRSFCVNRNRNSIPVLVYKPGQSWFTLVYVGLP